MNYEVLFDGTKDRPWGRQIASKEEQRQPCPRLASQPLTPQTRVSSARIREEYRDALAECEKAASR